MFDNYLKIENLNKDQKYKKKAKEGTAKFSSEMPISKKKAYEDLYNHIEYLRKIANNDDLSLLLMRDHNLFKLLLKILFHFKKEKHYDMKNITYNIFSNIFTLDNKYLEVRETLILLNF
jgi:hypothetical protein